MSKKCSCGEEIDFIDVKGKPHPVQRKVRKGFTVVNGRWELKTFVESHFSYCPDAKKHRG